MENGLVKQNGVSPLEKTENENEVEGLRPIKSKIMYFLKMPMLYQASLL